MTMVSGLPLRRCAAVFPAGVIVLALMSAADLRAQTPLAPIPAPTATAPRADILETIAGPWELMSAKTKRSCLIQLGTGRGPQGYVLGAPPACKTAVPAMAQVVGWSVGQDRTISFLDRSGATLALFKGDANGRFRSAEPDIMVMTPAGQGGDRAVAVNNALAKAGMADLPALTAESLFGLYGVARDKGKPICSIELTSRPTMRRGQYVSILSGGCIDQGMKIFDPIAWYTDRGRLHLVARKGHEQSFAQGPDRVFEKNPPSGAQIYLKKQ